MTNDPAMTSSDHAPKWYVWLSVAYLRLIRHAVRSRVLPWRWALLLTASYYEAAADAGMRFSASFYRAAADAGLRLDRAS